MDKLLLFLLVLLIFYKSYLYVSEHFEPNNTIDLAPIPETEFIVQEKQVIDIPYSDISPSYYNRIRCNKYNYKYRWVTSNNNRNIFINNQL